MERKLENMLDKRAKPTDSEERLNQFVRWRLQNYTLHINSKQQKKKTDSSSIDIITERELKNMLLKGVKQTDSEERLNQFVRWRIQEYTLHKWNNLSEIFAEKFTQQNKFQHFVKEDFEKLSKDNICVLRIWAALGWFRCLGGVTRSFGALDRGVMVWISV